MRIIACLKTVANPDVVELDLVSETLVNLQPVPEPLAQQILEESLCIREKCGGEIMALSVAPVEGETVLYDALLYGADEATRIWHGTLAGGDTFCAARAIAPVAQRHGFDLILCGSGSCDTGSEFMVPALAGLLDVPSATRIISFAGEETGGRITVHKKLTRGRREEYSIPLPAVIGLEHGINQPRYVAPFSRRYQAGREKKVVVVQAEPDRSPAGGLVSALRFVQPQPRVKVGIDISSLSMQDRLRMMRGELGGKKEMFEGAPEKGAEKILARLEKLR
jgi:electron transfer flavoprotein alpha/beta subunit